MGAGRPRRMRRGGPRAGGCRGGPVGPGHHPERDRRRQRAGDPRTSPTWCWCRSTGSEATTSTVTRRRASTGSRPAGRRPRPSSRPIPSLTFPGPLLHRHRTPPRAPRPRGQPLLRPRREAKSTTTVTGHSVEDGTWYGGEPIWVTAETQGMVAAAMLLVGTEADVGGVRPTFWTRYADRGTHRERVDQVLDWLALPAERRPHLRHAVLLVGRRRRPPLRTGVGGRRRGGGGGGRRPRAPARRHRRAAPRRCRLRRAGLRPRHGRGPPRRRRSTSAAVADLRGVRVVVSGPGANLFVPGSAARARAVRDDVNDGAGGGLAGGRAYLRNEVPAALRYRDNPRIGDVVVVADPGFMFDLGGARPPAGMHGWDPRHPDMHGIFLAAGPDIRPGRRIGPRRDRAPVPVPRPPAAPGPEPRRGRRPVRPRAGAGTRGALSRAPSAATRGHVAATPACAGVWPSSPPRSRSPAPASSWRR